MISYIEGKITYKDPTYLIVETNGIGYHVNITLNTYSEIKSLDKVKIHTHFHVREDAQSLYGFFDVDERKRFLQLLSISGVGTSAAVMVLSSLSASELHSAIVNNDVKTLCTVKGIGKKTAQRIVLELQDKLAKEELAEGSQSIISLGAKHSLKDEAMSALVTLGINKNEAEKTLSKILQDSDPDINLEQLIKLALKRA